jgi:SAM-dependent methyltransferase
MQASEKSVVLPQGALSPDYDYQIYYKLWHSESPEHARLMGQAFAAQLGPVLKSREQGPVLDVGCGMGFALLGLRQLGFTDLHGIDCDPGQARSARNLGLDVECVADSIEYLEQKPSQYGTILLLDVLEHVPVAKQILFLRAIRHSLRDNGRLVIQVPNANSLFASAWRYNDYTHTSSFTNVSLQFCLQNAGFKNVSFVQEESLSRPSFRLWEPRARASWGRWVLEQLWRSACRYQFGTDRHTSVTFGINLLGYADK